MTEKAKKFRAIVKEQLGDEWFRLLWPEFKKPYMQKLARFVAKERRRGIEIYPERENVFRAFRETPFSSVKAVIIGQDPYYNGEATGLAFGVESHQRIPPSLRNIFKELEDDIGFSDPSPCPTLEGWARQGVLLLNTSLTVRRGDGGGVHSRIGWKKFTTKALTLLSKWERPIVFIMWGNHARSFKTKLDPFINHFIESPHPSPLSAYRGFFGSNPFSTANEKLQEEGLEPIDWTETGAARSSYESNGVQT